MKNWKLIHVDRILAVRLSLCLLPTVIGICLLGILSVDDATEKVGVVLFVAGLAVTLYLLVVEFFGRCIPLFFISSVLRSGKHDRVSFGLPKRETRGGYEHGIVDAAKELRLSACPGDQGGEGVAPLYFGTGKYRSLYFDRGERGLLLYSCEVLDKELYGRYLADAMARCAELPRMKRSKLVRMQYGSGIVMLILTDRVAEDVRAALKETQTVREGMALLPVAVDCTAAAVYLNAEKDEGSDPLSIARNLVFRLLFDGKRPTEGDLTPEYLKLVREMEGKTFGEFLLEQKKESEESDAEEARLAEEMQDGEFRLVGILLYHKAAGKLMSLLVFSEADDADEADEDAEIELMPGSVLRVDPFWLNWTGKGSMTEKEKAVFFPEMRRELERRGFTVEVERN